MCLGSAPARYRRRREGTSSEKVKKRIRAPRWPESVGRRHWQTTCGRVRCARDERTQHPPRPVVHASLGLPRARSRCIRPAQRRDPALGSIGGADSRHARPSGRRWRRDSADAMRVHATDRHGHGRLRPNRGRRRPPRSCRRCLPATPPLAAMSGPARGVASGRPRTADVPPPGRKTPAAAIVGSVIGLAIVVALGAWFLLLRPGGNTALSSPSPSPIVLVSPSPEATDTAEPTAEPTDESTPAPTPFKAPTFTGKSLDACPGSRGRRRPVAGHPLSTRPATSPTARSCPRRPRPAARCCRATRSSWSSPSRGPPSWCPTSRVSTKPMPSASYWTGTSSPGPGPRRSIRTSPLVCVVSTDPAAGTEVDRGSSVDFVVSLGIEPSVVTCPDRGADASDRCSA